MIDNNKKLINNVKRRLFIILICFSIVFLLCIMFIYHIGFQNGENKSPIAIHFISKKKNINGAIVLENKAHIKLKNTSLLKWEDFGYNGGKCYNIGILVDDSITSSDELTSTVIVHQKGD